MALENGHEVSGRSNVIGREIPNVVDNVDGVGILNDEANVAAVWVEAGEEFLEEALQ